jgi:hypothetical protein
VWEKVPITHCLKEAVFFFFILSGTMYRVELEDDSFLSNELERIWKESIVPNRSTLPEFAWRN